MITTTDIKTALRKSGKAGRAVERLVGKTGVVRWLNSKPAFVRWRSRNNNETKRKYLQKVGLDKGEAPYFAQHIEEIKQVTNLLADEFSKKTFWSVIRFRSTYRSEYLNGIPVYPQYFQKDILPPDKLEIFVDGGGVRRHDRAGVRHRLCAGFRLSRLCLGVR